MSHVNNCLKSIDTQIKLRGRMLCRSLNIKYIGLPKKYRELNYILLILTEGTNSYLNDNQNNEKFGY